MLVEQPLQWAFCPERHTWPYTATAKHHFFRTQQRTVALPITFLKQGSMSGLSGNKSGSEISAQSSYMRRRQKGKGKEKVAGAVCARARRASAVADDRGKYDDSTDTHSRLAVTG